MWLMRLTAADGGLLFVVALIGGLYWRSRYKPGHGAASAGAAGLLATVALFLSPIDQFAGEAQATHMAQHMLLAFVVAPLLVKAELAPAIGAILLGRSGPQAVNRSYVALGWLSFAATMIFWHLPNPFAWSAGDGAIHAMENLCFLGAGYLFWSVLLTIRGQRALTGGIAVMYCGSAVALTDLVGAVMTFSRHELYLPGLCRSEAIGLTQLQDQQLAGILMWIPGTFVLLTFCAVLFPALLKHAERKSWSVSENQTST